MSLVNSTGAWPTTNDTFSDSSLDEDPVMVICAAAGMCLGTTAFLVVLAIYLRRRETAIWENKKSRKAKSKKTTSPNTSPKARGSLQFESTWKGGDLQELLTQEDLGGELDQHEEHHLENAVSSRDFTNTPTNRSLTSPRPPAVMKVKDIDRVHNPKSQLR
eukprot:PhF_6_TR34471/c0_g1_i1/m.50321